MHIPQGSQTPEPESEALRYLEDVLMKQRPMFHLPKEKSELLAGVVPYRRKCSQYSGD